MGDVDSPERDVVRLPLPDRTPAEGVEREIIGLDAIQKLVREKVAQHDVRVLITGETGTGKELIARAIHAASKRAQRPFVAVDCGAMHESLATSELFGHEMGSFTSATFTREGYFETADTGTIFLDEISNLSLGIQQMLLRVIEEGEIMRVGASRVKKIDVRVIAAANRDLNELVKKGRFREDLLYRLAVFRIAAPALRDRDRAEFCQLVDFFIKKISAGKSLSPVLTGNVIDVLFAHNWPGNVRELENAIEHACIMCDSGFVEVSHLPPNVVPKIDCAATAERSLLSEISSLESDKITRPVNELPLFQQIRARGGLIVFEKELDRRILMLALKLCDNNKQQAANLLGMNRTTLIERLRKLEGVGDNY